MIDFPQDIIRGRVHRLPAGNNSVSSELTEELFHALARTHCHRTVFFLRRGYLICAVFHGFQLLLNRFQVIRCPGFASGSHVIMLGAHILDLCQFQRSVFL